MQQQEQAELNFASSSFFVQFWFSLGRNEEFALTTDSVRFRGLFSETSTTISMLLLFRLKGIQLRKERGKKWSEEEVGGKFK